MTSLTISEFSGRTSRCKKTFAPASSSEAISFKCYISEALKPGNTVVMAKLNRSNAATPNTRMLTVEIIAE